MRKLLFSLGCLVAALVSGAQDKSNRGKEFWLAYGFDYSFFHETPINNQELAIYISTELAATVTVAITNTGYTQTLNIPANTVDATILIPKSGPNDARTLTDGLQNRGIHIVSNVPVAVYAHVYSTQVSGATMLMPVETYGYSYHSINYYQTTSQSSPADWYSWFYAIASEDNTRLEITPSDTTKNGWLPGQTYTVNLNKGQSFHVFGKAIFDGNAANASKDMTGSKIVSVVGGDGVCHPVAVFSGSGGIRLCRGDGGEFMHQQVFPSQAWGTRYLTYHTINNTNTNITETNRNYYRVCVADPTTIVKRNGVVLNGLLRNFYYEFMDSTGGDYIEADKPILVSQYSTNKNQCWNFPFTTPSPPSYGDPEMFYLSPIEQGQKSVLFYVSRRSSIDYVYTNIHLPTSAVASLRVDGAPLPAGQIVTHPNLPSYSVALARFTGPAAQHRITADSAFTATVYGLGNYESYGYNVGTLINNLNHYSSIKNVNSTLPVDTFTCKNTPARLFVKIAYPALSITWKLSQVPGMSPNVDSVSSNPVPVNTELINGRTYYVYSLQQDFLFASPGTYYLPVSYTSSIIPNCNQTDTASIKIVVSPGPVADFTWPAAVCLQDTIPFTGTSVPGRFNLTAYNWLFDDAGTATTLNTGKRFLTSGNHDVRYRVIADNGCSGDTIKTITILNNPVARFGMVTSVCEGDSVYLTDTSSVAGGTISNWYWNFGDGSNLSTNSGRAFYHLYPIAGTYQVSLVVTSSNGCKSDTLKRDINVIVMSNNLGPDITQCNGSIVVLDPGASAPGNSFLWQDGSTNRTFTTTTAGLYWVHVSNGSGCSRRDSINVVFSAAPFFNLGADTSICTNDTLMLNATVPNATAYAWSNGATTSTIKAFQVGMYWCEVSIGTCRFRDSLQIISLRAAPVVNLGNDVVTCAGTSVRLDVTNANATYTWQDGSTNAVYRATTSGLYWAEALNNMGCRSRDSVNITFTALPVFNLGPDLAICAGDSLLLNGALPNASGYTWSTGSTQASIKVFQPGLYWCEVSRSGCLYRDSLLLTAVKPKPVVNLGSDQSVCEGVTVNLDASYAGATYLWQNASTLGVFPVTSQGVYYVQVDLNGCKAADTVAINYLLKPSFDLGQDRQICQGVPVLLSPVLNPVWQLNWQDGSAGTTYNVTQPGTYVLTATNNCGSSTDQVIFSNGVCSVFMPSAFTPNGDGANDIFKVLGTGLITSLELKIFNRYGQVVFESSDKNRGWDGKLKGTPSPGGGFVYLLTYKDINSTETKMMKGSFILIR